MDINKECINIYNKKLKNKLSFIGISNDIGEALKILYNNIDFREIPIKFNNKLVFLDDCITFKDYTYSKFKSDDKNPCFAYENINLFIKKSVYEIKENVFKRCIDIKLKIKISKRSTATVHYKIPINSRTFRHIERFISVCEIIKQYEDKN